MRGVACRKKQSRKRNGKVPESGKCSIDVLITAVGDLDGVGQRVIAMDKLLRKCTNLVLLEKLRCAGQVQQVSGRTGLCG